MKEIRRPERWDYIIIGAGSAGCAVAYEIAMGHPEARILMLESGGSDRGLFVRVPAGVARLTAKYDWGYRSEPDPSCNGASEAWTRGRVLGGSSSVNSTVYVRGAARDFDRWAARLTPGQVNGWGSNEVMSLFRELENSDQKNASRGHSGPLHVRTVKHPHPITNAFISAAVACGHPFNEDYNGERQGGVAYAQFSQVKGLRCSSADAFLRPLLRRNGNVTLALNASVQKIEMARGRAVAVTFIRGGKIIRERAEEIILCAGAVNSPQLLMLSGIGDPQELKRHNIEVRAELPGVGRNLREHPSLRLLFKSRIPTYNPTEGIVQKVGFLNSFLSKREGPLSNIFESVAFLKTSSTQPFEDIQVHFSPVGQLDTRESCAIAPYPSVSVVINKSGSSGKRVGTFRGKECI